MFNSMKQWHGGAALEKKKEGKAERVLGVQVLFQDPSGAADDRKGYQNLCWAAILASAVNFLGNCRSPISVLEAAAAILKRDSDLDVEVDLGAALTAFKIDQDVLDELQSGKDERKLLKDPDTLKKIAASIDDGHPVVLQLSKKKATHFVFVVGYRKKGGDVTELGIKDPSGAVIPGHKEMVPDHLVWKPPFATYERYRVDGVVELFAKGATRCRSGGAASYAPRPSWPRIVRGGGGGTGLGKICRRCGAKRASALGRP